MKDIIKSFLFTEKERTSIFLSDNSKIRVNTENSTNKILQLKLDDNNNYSLDVDIIAKTNLINPNAVRGWLKFESIKSIPNSTDIKYRLDNDVNEYYHDGADWVIASSTDWNTEEEINEKINEYDFNDDVRTIRIVINLSTTNKKVTPYIKELKILGVFDINFKNDILYDSLIHKMKSDVRYNTKMAITTVGLTSSIDLSSTYKIENQEYNIVGIVSVFDEDNDPMNRNNLFDIYTPGILQQNDFFEHGVINLLSSINDNTNVTITLIIAPDFAINTNQDYFELNRVPGIVFDSIIYQKIISDPSIFDRENIKDKINNTAIELERPLQYNIIIKYSIFTLLQFDLLELQFNIDKFFKDNPIIKSKGIDLDYPLIHTNDGESTQQSNLDDINVNKGSFVIKNILEYLQDSNFETLVKNVNINLENN